MIFVDMDSLIVSTEWAAKASAATAELIAAPDDESRKKILASSSGIWGDIKSKLAALGSGKCWYCEIGQERSDMVVDHYRPKGRVGMLRSHPGYWWLAFTPTNFRYACTYCNSRRVDEEMGTSGGKQDFFPLADEAMRAVDRFANLDVEGPLLLDPTIAEDPCFLFFDDEGRAIPHPRLSPAGSTEYLRAITTIDLLHLNHRGVCEQRKRVNRTLRRAFMAAVRNYQGYVSGDPGARQAFKDALYILTRAVQSHTELSATARAFLRGRRGDPAPAGELVDILV